MSPKKRRHRGRKSGPKPTGSPEYAMFSMGGSEEEMEDLLAGAVLASGAGIVYADPLDGPAAAETVVPERLFVAIVGDDYAPLQPLFAARGTGDQPWEVKGQTGWTAGVVRGDPSPARVVLKLMLTEPVAVNAKILFLPALTGEGLAVAAQGGWVALMTASAWQAIAELAPEGGTVADLLERAVLVELEPSLTLGPFLAALRELPGGPAAPG